MAPEIKHATEVNNMLVTEWDQAIADRVRFAEGKAEGRAEGEAEGKAKGEAKAKAELVANMASHNLSAQQIADLAGLSVDVVERMLLHR
jgi:predicted transposase/invertase (TIGR01784 family)